MCGLDARVAAVIRIDAVWLTVEPQDIRSGVAAGANVYQFGRFETADGC